MIDLTVGDIAGGALEDLPETATASNFGKVLDEATDSRYGNGHYQPGRTNHRLVGNISCSRRTSVGHCVDGQTFDSPIDPKSGR